MFVLPENFQPVKVVKSPAGTIVCSVEPHPLSRSEPVIRFVRYEGSNEDNAPHILCLPVAESLAETSAKLQTLTDEFIWLITGLTGDELYDFLEDDGADKYGLSAELSGSFYFPFGE